MTSPVEDVLVRCPRCGQLFRDWLRSSINPDLDSELAADIDYVARASTVECPACGEVSSGVELSRGREMWSESDPGGFPDWSEIGAKPSRDLRVVSLNLRATPNRRPARLVPLIELLDAQTPDVVLLQEARPAWTAVICRELELDGVSTHELLRGTPGLPADGCAVAVRSPLRILSALPIAPALFSPPAIEAKIGPDTIPGKEDLPHELLIRFRGRSLLVRIADGLHEFVAGSFHATPGTGRFGPKPGTVVNNWKPFFHGGIAAALADLDTPFVFAIDANEPRSETLDSVTFHWREGRPGAKKFASLLGLKPVHRGRDLLREDLRATGRPPASDTFLALTYTTHGGGSSGRRRFDSMWATPEFRLRFFRTDYPGALAAGTDHAMLAADIELWLQP